MSKPKLISFKVCPFVQRSVILLNEKGIDFDIEFIDVYNPPEWFLKLSPTGKVPILQVDNVVLFESAVISEYLDEVYPEPLHPADPLVKAQNRAWIEYTSALYMDSFNLLMAKTKDDVNNVLESLNKNLTGLQNAKKETPWFNGDDFSLVDIAAAPFFVRAAFFKENSELDLLANYAELQAWSDLLLARQTVIYSIVEGFNEMLISRMESNQSYLSHA
ncbi:MAG: glutathione S-transferase family protein [Cocleimonas sp.]